MLRDPPNGRADATSSLTPICTDLSYLGSPLLFISSAAKEDAFTGLGWGFAAKQ
jgi:hypothetical protein